MSLKDRLQACMDDAVAQQELAGVTMLVLRHGQELVYAQSGMADREEERPMVRDTICRLYSQTKPITAAAVMALMEQGRLDLCEPVETFLPGFHDQKVWTAEGLVPAVRPVTVLDLLGMAAGVCYPGDDPAGRAAEALFAENDRLTDQGQGMTTVELMNAVGQLPLAFQPGTHFRYSTCADVLGAVVEVCSGMPFPRFLEKTFFEPLGMKDTAFWVPEDKMDRFATVYEHPGALEPFEKVHLSVGAYGAEPAYCAGGAGLVSTLDDYSRFATMLLRGGALDGTRILQRETVDYFTAPQLGHTPADDLWNSLDGFNYGKLMRVMTAPGRYPGLSRMGEYGWDGWLGCYFANFPREQMTMLLMIQRTDYGTGRLTRKLRNILLSSPEAE